MDISRDLPVYLPRNDVLPSRWAITRRKEKDARKQEKRPARKTRPAVVSGSPRFVERSGGGAFALALTFARVRLGSLCPLVLRLVVLKKGRK